MKALAGKVALVAGATRGAGRGIARMLGEAGATVYCTGRGSRARPSSAGDRAGRPETVEETAEMVDAAGGVGVAVRVDHAVEAEVAALVERVRAEHGRLDVAVNVLGGSEVTDPRPFWEQPVEPGRALVDGWIWPHVVTARHVAPLMVERRSGLMVQVVEGDALGFRVPFYFDLVLVALKRLSYALAEELAPHGVASVAVAPGFMRTEAILDHFGATAEGWEEAARTHPEAIGYGFAGSETPCFVGRAVAALAADPAVVRRTGGLFSSWGLSEEYGFTDVDGRRPHWGRYLAEHFPRFHDPAPASGRRWKVA